MPLAGFICPATRLKVPFDHFESCTHGLNGRPACPPWLARAIATGEQNDIRHAKLALTATRILGCPRAEWIKHTQDYWLDPMKVAVRQRGTELHARMAAALDPRWWITELNDPMRCTVEGRLFPQLVRDGAVEVDGSVVTEAGVQVSAKLDAMRLRDEHDRSSVVEICDGKFPKDWSIKFRSKVGEAKDDHSVQLSVQRLLLEQQQWFPENMRGGKVALTIWDHACGDSDGPVALAARGMGEEEILAAYAFHGDTHTIAENVIEWVVMLQATARATAADIELPPCTGATRFKGMGCLKYCDVSRESELLSVSAVS